METHGFQKKSIKTNLGLGDKLKAARKKKKISLDKAELDTRIRLHYLEAIEKNQLQIIPISHLKGFIKRYASYLGLSPLAIISELELRSATNAQRKIFSPATLGKETKWIITPKLGFTVLACILLLIFVGYVGYQIKQFAAPPTLIITKPEPQTAVTTEQIQIEGRTDPGTSLFIDNLQASLKDDGSFSYPLVVRPGLNQIAIRAVNRIKKESNKTLTILYSPNPQPSLSPSPH